METLTTEVPTAHSARLRDMLKQCSGVTFEDRGCVIRKFTITGSPEAIARLRPLLDRFHADRLAEDAW